MGALLGRISPIQLLVMGLIEIILFASNEFLQIELMKVPYEFYIYAEIKKNSWECLNFTYQWRLFLIIHKTSIKVATLSYLRDLSTFTRMI